MSTHTPAKRSVLGILASVAIVALAGCGLEPTATGNGPTSVGQLVYSTSDSANGAWALRAIAADGSPPTRLLRASRVSLLDESPDGSKFAYVEDRGNVVVVVNRGLGEIDRWTLSQRWVGVLDWSPNGRRLAAQLDVDQWNREVDIVTLGGGRVSLRAPIIEAEEAVVGPVDSTDVRLWLYPWRDNERVLVRWSPYRLSIGAADGTATRVAVEEMSYEELEAMLLRYEHVAPSLSRKLYFDVDDLPWISRLDGSDARAVSPSGSAYNNIAFRSVEIRHWAPDESAVVLLRERPPCDPMLPGGFGLQPHVILLDGSREAPLAEEGCWRFQSWSPDSRWIAAIRTDVREPIIHLFRVDGSEHREIVVGSSQIRVEQVAWIQSP